MSAHPQSEPCQALIPPVPLTNKLTGEAEYVRQFAYSMDRRYLAYYDGLH